MLTTDEVVVELAKHNEKGSALLLKTLDCLRATLDYIADLERRVERLENESK
jgi:hypothetical protein